MQLKSVQSTCAELDGWLKSVDKSRLPRKFKAWVYQHDVPRILWPLLVYAVPISAVQTLERKVSNQGVVNVLLVKCIKGINTLLLLSLVQLANGNGSNQTSSTAGRSDAVNTTVQRFICRRLCLLIQLTRAPDPANEGLHNQLMSWIRAVLFRNT
ncbi:hypothetical protein SRHO_G00189270 [Serrasalmus rhombeus]